MLAACEGLTAAACLQHQLQFSKLEAADAACWCCQSVCLLEFSPVVPVLPRAQPYPSCSTSAAARAWLPALEQHGQNREVQGRCSIQAGQMLVLEVCLGLLPDNTPKRDCLGRCMQPVTTQSQATSCILRPLHNGQTVKVKCDQPD